MQLCIDGKILPLKEEADSSHFNQVYDIFFAKLYKETSTEFLAMMCGATHVIRGVVDQWDIVHIGLIAIRATKRQTWTSSFDACNLDPRTRRTFEEWCKKTKNF